MPGKRFKYRATKGHLKGQDVRVLTCSETPFNPEQGCVIVETRYREVFQIPGEWITSKQSEANHARIPAGKNGRHQETNSGD